MNLILALRTEVELTTVSTRSVRRAVAMNGEVFLKGKISAVGGIFQRAVAA